MKKNITYIITIIVLFSMISIGITVKAEAKEPAYKMVETDTNNTSGMLSMRTTNVDYSSICSLETEGNKGIRQTFKMVGYFIQVIKWIAPLTIIVLGMIDFGKAAISNDDKAINKATTSLIRRVLSGIVIFFIPTIVMAVLNVLEVYNGLDDNFIDPLKKEVESQFGACTKCLFDPFNSCPTEKASSESGTAGGGGTNTQLTK